MPQIFFVCTECDHQVRRFYAASDVKGIPNKSDCPECQAKDGLVRQLGRPASVSKVRIDNGLQSKAVEIRPDIIEINEKASNKNYKKDY